jgi:uncharacterized Fe-S radical SAM superfamily protein PflX
MLIFLQFQYLTMTNVRCRNFDQSLRRRDANWGIRDLEAVQKAAQEQGLVFVETIEMPANNLSVIFRKPK